MLTDFPHYYEEPEFIHNRKGNAVELSPLKKSPSFLREGFWVSQNQVKLLISTALKKYRDERTFKIILTAA
ncbi:MAG: hypothetical protein RLO81_12950 [Fulvivirga sp.]